MDITWLGHSCFIIRGKNVTLITDPFSPQYGDTTRLSKANTSIITISHNAPESNATEGIPGANNRAPRVVRGPGEYEISDVLITGVASQRVSKEGQELGRNTIYIIHVDDIAVCHLGDIGHVLQEEQLEEVADADILLLPINNTHGISVAQAIENIGLVEPRIIVPMEYHPESLEEQGGAIDKFCREMSVDKTNVQQKLTVTRNTLTNLPSTRQVVLLSVR